MLRRRGKELPDEQHGCAEKIESQPVSIGGSGAQIQIKPYPRILLRYESSLIVSKFEKILIFYRFASVGVDVMDEGATNSHHIQLWSP